MALRGGSSAPPGTCTFYTPDLDAAYRRRQVLERELRSALNREELTLAYQPVVDLASGRVLALEALLRWENPSLGEVPPGLFVPLAEESGLIVPIGAWVLDAACDQLARWQREGLEEVTVAVNVSARQLLDPELVAQVRARLAGRDLDPRRLTLEVTETAVIQNLTVARAHLTELRALGVRVCIDDFGTGYASLSYLSRLPAQLLKMDRSFLHGGDGDGPEVPVIRAVISLGSSLGLGVVAEGVESAEQLALLRELGCPAAQGNALAPAMAAEQVPEAVRVGALAAS
jgi:EAL domain-containing protein (putative c-di-GMP-specific phosphodiesterase class I)